MIGRVTEMMSAQMMLAQITQSQDRLQTTQEELSSGKRINQPSDDPYGTTLALALQGQLTKIDAYTSNVTDGTAWAEAGQTAMTNISNMVQRVRELTVEAANGTNTQADMQADGAEVSQLITAIKQEANTQYNGQYIFAGTATSTAPYPSGSNTYQGNASPIYREIGPGSTTIQVGSGSVVLPAAAVQVNVNLSSALGSGGGDGLMLDTLTNIQNDMNSGNAAALSGKDLSALDTNFTSLTQLQATLGSTQNSLQLASSRLQDLRINDTQVLSNTQDADMAQTMINYSTEQAAYTAALRAGANIVQTSLMDFLR